LYEMNLNIFSELFLGLCGFVINYLEQTSALLYG
jgi:hypothetical protein